MSPQVANDVIPFFDSADQPDIQQQLGSFVIREGIFSISPTNPNDMETFWRSKALACPELAKFALGLLAIAPTEAAVERAFSHRKLLHNPLRNALKDASVEALMFVRMNAPLLGAVDA